MKRSCIKTASIFMLLASLSVHAGNFIRYRSQSFDNARKNAGLVGHTHLYDKEHWYGTFDIIAAGGRSFRASRLAECLFDCYINDCGEILVQGSDVEDRSPRALLADYFYLPTDFSSVVTIKPQITNVLANFDLYIGFRAGCQDLYFRLYGPVVWTKWDLNFCERCINEGENPHPCGYFTPGQMDRDLLLNNFGEFARGLHPNTVSASIMQGDAIQDIDINFQGLCAARMTNCKDTETAFADLRAEFGWNFIIADDYLFGLYLAAAAPTGNRIEARNLFAPVAGNGHHWELGGGVNAKWIFWRCEEEDRHFGLYLDATMNHLFKAREQHTLDVAGKPLSRYMLLERLGEPIIGALANGDDENPSAQFKYEYAPLANFSTVDVNVSIGVQADIALWLNYSTRCLSWDIGYEFFGQSCAKFSNSCSCSSSCSSCTSFCSTSVKCGPDLCDPSQENTWAFKGDAQVFGFDADRQTANIDCFNVAVPLSATQSEATVSSGNNGDDFVNGGVDNVDLAFGDSQASGAESNNRLPLYNSIDLGREQINSSFDPVFVGCCDLDFCTTGRPLSNKVWTHLNYTWTRCDWRPYVGIGGEVEFGTTEDDCCTSTCNPCNDFCNVSCTDCFDCGVSQWQLWIKGGVSFE